MVYTVTHDVASKDDKAPTNKPEVTASVIVQNKYHSAFTLQKPLCSCPGLPHGNLRTFQNSKTPPVQ